MPKLSELIKPINDILKKSNKLHKLYKINPLTAYSKGKGPGRRKSPNIQEFWTQKHTDNFEAIKKLIVKAPVLHLPNRDGKFSPECDSSAKHVGAVLYQHQNGCNNIVAFFSFTMPDAAVRYSSSELELCGLKKAILHFQYLLKYASFRVLMDHSALKNIYCLKKSLSNLSEYKGSWKKCQIILSHLNMFLVKICLCVTFCHAFRIIKMMGRPYHL